MQLPSFDFFGWLLRWGQVLAAFGSLFVSGVLAYLYYQQKTLLEIERKPSLEVSDFDVDGDSIQVYISNYGSGIAKNLRLRTVVSPSAEEGEYSVERSLNRYENDTTLRDRSIGGEQREITFRAEPPFAFDEDKRYGDFSSGVWKALDEGINEFEFWLEVVYDTQLDDTGSVDVFLPGRWVQLDEEQVEKFRDLGESADFEAMYSMGGFAPRR